MKHVLPIVLSSLLSAFAGAAAYHYLFEPPQQVLIQESMPVRYTNFAAPAPSAREFASAAPTSFTTAAEKVTPSVVNIRAIGSGNSSDMDFWGGQMGSTGSGVIISSDGYIVTNNHVVEGARQVEVSLSDKRSFQAEVVGTDPSTDLALLKVKSSGLAALEFADSDALLVGEWVLAVGNPFNLESTVTAGIVSAKARSIDILDDLHSIESFIQTDAVVNPGNSGGALVNTLGELVGINTAIMTRSGRYEGYSFAVPANLVRKVVSDLREFGKVQRGFLGVKIRDMDAKLAQDLGLDKAEGVYITSVSSQGAAEDAGLQAGDVVISVNGSKVRSIPELQEQVARFRPGNAIELGFIRAGKKRTTRITLKNQYNTTSLAPTRQSELLEKLGLELRDLSDEERQRLKVRGIMVLSVRKGSVIDRTNMDPGYIITKVNEQSVASLDDLLEALNNTSGKVMLEGVYENYPGEYYYAFKN